MYYIKQIFVEQKVNSTKSNWWHIKAQINVAATSATDALTLDTLLEIFV